VARLTGISRTAVSHIEKYFFQCGKSFAEVLALDDKALNDLIYPPQEHQENERRQVFNAILPTLLEALGRKHETLEHQWELYLARHPDGFGYSRFCALVGEAAGDEGDDISISLAHPYGDAAFADFAGDKLHYFHPLTGEKIPVEVFVSILPASQLIYAQGCLSQKTLDLLSAATKSLIFFGGVPKLYVTDCLRAAVKTPHRYESEIAPQFEAFALHHGMVAAPARPAHPRDKALVENAVNNLYRWVYPRLLDSKFTSLEELNAAILELVVRFNDRMMRGMGCSRRARFEAEERGCLKSLPQESFVAKEFQPARRPAFDGLILNKNDDHRYSVPWRRYKERMTLFTSVNTVEIYAGHERVATYVRSQVRGGATINPEHLHPRYGEYLKWNPTSIQTWADKISLDVGATVAQLFSRAQHPNLAMQSSLGLMSLGKKYGEERLTHACRRAFSFGEVSMRQVERILIKGLDRQYEEQATFFRLPQHHQNLRIWTFKNQELNP
jgi:transposase